MTDPCDRLHAYVDGELDADETAAFEAHLASCDACNAELPRLLALMSALDAAAAHRAAMPSGTQRLTVLPGGLEDAASAPRERPPAEHGSRRADPRRRPRWIAAGALAVFAAAAVIALVVRAPSPPAPAVVAMLAAQLRPGRTIEPRLSYAGVDQHRPLDNARGERVHEDLSLLSMGKLEAAGDWHGLGVASLLNGDRERAATSLAKAPETAAVDSDRAALALLDGRPEALERALTAADRALADAPNHGPALWNRALVLAGLNLQLAAARDFDRVAALGEPGWAEEARTRASALRAEVAQRRIRWQQVNVAGQRLIADGTLVPPDLLSVTGYMTLTFYDAVRSAPSRARVEALLPMAQVLDRAYRSERLAAYVRRIAASDFAIRKPLADTYRPLALHQPMSAEDTAAFLRRLEHAHADDIRMGAMVLTRDISAHLEDYRRLAVAANDPWLALIAEQEAAKLEIARDETPERRLRDALAVAKHEHLTYRALLLERALAALYRAARDPARANREGQAVYRETRSAGESLLEMNALLELIAINQDRYAHGLAQAYLAELLEWTESTPATGPSPFDADNVCKSRRYGHESLANLALLAGDAARARAEISRAPSCPDGATLVGAQIWTGLARVSHRDDDAARARASFAARRALRPLPNEQALLDHLEGSLLIDTDRPTAQRLLRAAIAKASRAADSHSVPARAYSYSLLALDAGRASEFGDVIGVLAETLEVPRPSRCAIAIAVEGRRSVVAFADAQGQTGGAYDGARTAIEVDASTLVPASIVARVRSCEHVVVLASAPVLGAARLLPSDIAWSYRLGSRAAPAVAQPGTLRRLVIATPEAPPELDLPPLAPVPDEPGASDVEVLRGAEATPTRVSLAMRDASVIEFHSHGVIANDVSEASYLVLAPELDGQYAMTASDIARVELTASPLVILASCHAAASSRSLEGGTGLAEALLRSGARAVIASPDAVQDLGAHDFFAAVRQDVLRGTEVAVAVRDERIRIRASSPDETWVTGIVVFE